MKKQVLLFLSLLFFTFGYSQTEKAWKQIKNENVERNKNVQRESFPKDFKLIQLDMSVLKQTLLSAPDRSSETASNTIITIPNASGELEHFRMYEASNFDDDLQAQFPEIRAYVGQGVDDPTAILRLSLDPRGIQTAVFRADKKSEFMEPYSNDGKVYAVFTSSRQKGKLPFTCSTTDVNITNDLSKTVGNNFSSAGSLKTFRLALSCTAEYSNYFGATNAFQQGLVLAAFNATMTRVNGVFEKDFAIHMDIISQSTNVIYYNATTDPYSNAATGASGAWNTELQNNLSANLTGPSTSLAANNAVYDVGHLFGASGGGGNAGCIGCVCTNDTSSTSDKNKGSAYTSPADDIPSGDNFDIDYVAHEMGHQYGANHTFSMSNEGSGVNMEVGSGSTIMGYAGITSYNVQAHSDDHFHAASIAQVQSDMVSKTCPTSTAITHGTPVVNAGADYTIPKSTPFMLTASATDSGGTSGLTYCWEQFDNASAAQINASSAASATKSSGPNWMSYSPTTSPTRYFPIMSSIFAGSTTTQGADIAIEALSSVGRTLNFRCTVRDNEVSPAGQTNYDNAIITVDASKGPLTVTSQNTDGIAYPTSSSQTVTWAVNSTNSSPGGSTVDILITTDNGETWTTLLSNTTNNGSAAVTMPATNHPYCRLMVKASGNVFFNVNSKDFAVGDYTYETQNVCDDYVFDLDYTLTESSGTSYPGIVLPISDSYTITDIKTYADITHPNIGQVNILFWFPWSTGLNTGIWYNQTSCTNANMDKWFDLAGSAPDCSTNGGSPFTPFSTTNFGNAIGQNSAG